MPYCKQRITAKVDTRSNSYHTAYIPQVRCTIALCVITQARALKVLIDGSTLDAIREAILAVACQLIRLRLPGYRFGKFIVNF